MIVLEIIVSLHDDWRHRFNGIRCIFMTSVLVAKNGSIVQWQERKRVNMRGILTG